MYYCIMILTSEQHPHLITTSSAKMFVDDDNIFITKFNDNALLRIEQVKEIITHYEHFNESKPQLVLAIAGSHTNITPAAREYAESYGAPAIAEAIVVSTLAQRFLVNLYMHIRNNEHPVNVFSDIENAKKWLLSYVN